MGSILFDGNAVLDATKKSNETANEEKNQLLSKETLEGTAALTTHQQLEIDEEQMNANITILGLTETNQHLKCRNKEYEFKMNAVIAQSDKLIEAYENELTSKIELIELYKANCESNHLDYQAHVSELEAGVTMLQQMLFETVDTCEYLEVKVHENEEKHQRQLDEKDEIITMLKQELKHMTVLLNTDARENDEHNKKEPEHDIETLNVENCCSKKDVSLTETQRIIEKIEKDIEDKERYYDELQMQIKYLTDNLLIEPTGTNFKSNVPKIDEASQNVLAKLENPNQTLSDLIPKMQQIKLSESNLHSNGHEKKTEQHFEDEKKTERHFRRREKDTRDFPTLCYDKFSKIPSNCNRLSYPGGSYRMTLRSKKRPRTDIKNEVILLSDDEEIIVCDQDDDCVPVPRTQADELRYALSLSSNVNAETVKRETEINKKAQNALSNAEVHFNDTLALRRNSYGRKRHRVADILGGASSKI